MRVPYIGVGLFPVDSLIDTLNIPGVQMTILAQKLATVLFVALSHDSILICKRFE